MKPDCKYFREYEEAAYVRGYKDGLVKAMPEVKIPEGKHKHIQNESILELLSKNVEGMNAAQLQKALSISRGTFYKRIKALVYQGKVKRVERKFPIRFQIV